MISSTFSATAAKAMLTFFPTYGSSGNNTHAQGSEYNQMFHVFEDLSPFYSDFEKSYDPVPVSDIMKENNFILPVTCVVVYAAFCYFGQSLMKNYRAFDLIVPLAVWNLFLATFSAYGAIRTVPHMLHRISTLPFVNTVCETSHVAYGHGSVGLASQLFILSKIPELIDTVFIVLRKKPLIFLHWYHHVTVLLYCWNAYVTESSAGLYFISMNYTVHAVMYFYYFLQAVRMMPKWFPSWLITIMQISQMMVGTFVVAASVYYHFVGGGDYAPTQCGNTPSNLASGAIIYSSYLYLFVEFAVKRFLFNTSAPVKGKKVTKTL